MNRREQTQSIAVNEEEKLLIDALAIAAGLKPAAFSRNIFFRGLMAFIKDRHVREPGMLEDEIKQQLLKLIAEDAELGKAYKIALEKSEATSKRLPGEIPRSALIGIATHDPNRPMGPAAEKAEKKRQEEIAKKK